ncbi:MAG: acylphosphatase [Rhodoplanes sp.]
MSIVRHVVVRGRVQGVGFRMFVEDTAQPLNLEGWVRNKRDGSVEAVFAGPDEAVSAAVEACREGPRGSLVESVDVGEGSLDLLQQRNPGERFSVLRTA